MLFRNGSDKATALHSVQISEKGKHKPYTEIPDPQRPKNETGEEKSQEHAYIFLCHKGDCSERIHPGRPNSQFRILLLLFTATA
jgi:hypothetical protein